MSDLVDFLRARLDEDEQAARAAKEQDTGRWFVGDKWNVYDEVDLSGLSDTETNQLVAYGNFRTASEHIARHDPARVLAEVDAKRRAVNYLANELADHGLSNPWWYDDKIIPVLKLLARTYADHPDYRQEWRP